MGRHYLATDRQQVASGEEGAWSQPLALGLGHGHCLAAGIQGPLQWQT